jgi:hypothetical protein
MARRKARVRPAQKWTGYGILTLLVLITAGLLIQQSRFNPAVGGGRRAPPAPGGGPPPPPPRGPGVSPAAPGPTQPATARMFPQVPGFTSLGPVESFGPETLSDKIDGKAELYLAAGFKNMSCRSFNLGGAHGIHVDVYLYDMGTPNHAFAVFSEQRRPGSTTIPLTANAYTTPNALFFTRGRFYVEIVAAQTSGTLHQSLQAYATALLAKLPASGGGDANPAALFPPDGLARDTVRLSAADTFGLQGLNNVYTGEYRFKSGTATAFIAARPTPAAAQADAKRYLDFLAANGYKPEPAPPGLPEAKLLVLDDSYEIVMVRGKTLAGVHDATSREAALELAAKLQKALAGPP